jgi:hypothetical protein
MLKSSRILAICFISAACLLIGACDRFYQHKVAPQHAVSTFFENRARRGGGGDRDRLSTDSVGAMMVANAGAAFADYQVTAPAAQDRKIIRNGSLDLLVNDVSATVDKVRTSVEAVGGYVEKAEQRHTGSTSASMIVRVPVAHLDEAMVKIKAMATRVDADTVEAKDVTREFIDLDARLRNAQAEEGRYLEIMNRASTVKDTLEVAGKLSEVRGRIEQMQGEMNYLKTQISLSRLDVSLHAEAEATVVGLHWRPLRQAKAASIDMLQGLADWMDSVIGFLINLPLILVWCVSIIVLVAIAWRLVRFVWRKLFPNASVFPAWLRRPKPTLNPSA